MRVSLIDPSPVSLSGRGEAEMFTNEIFKCLYKMIKKYRGEVIEKTNN